MHLYDDIDASEVFSILESDLGDFDAFIGALTARYFEDEPDG